MNAIKSLILGEIRYKKGNFWKFFNVQEKRVEPQYAEIPSHIGLPVQTGENKLVERIVFYKANGGGAEIPHEPLGAVGMG